MTGHFYDVSVVYIVAELKYTLQSASGIMGRKHSEASYSLARVGGAREKVQAEPVLLGVPDDRLTP